MIECTLVILTEFRTGGGGAFLVIQYFCKKSLAAFPSTCFYAHFGLSHKKTLDGNAKMRINSKMRIKNLCAHLSRIHFFIQ